MSVPPVPPPRTGEDEIAEVRPTDRPVSGPKTAGLAGPGARRCRARTREMQSADEASWTRIVRWLWTGSSTLPHLHSAGAGARPAAASQTVPTYFQQLGDGAEDPGTVLVNVAHDKLHDPGYVAARGAMSEPDPIELLVRQRADQRAEVLRGDLKEAQGVVP